jgi:hypothetical protein
MSALHTKPRARGVALSIAAWICAITPACLVDLDQRCGEHQHYDPEQANCACNLDYTLTDGVCVPCGENETSSSDGCVCVEGFTRATPEAACEALAGLGQACQADADCGDERYPHCRLEAELGYCTGRDCGTAADCPTDYGCNTRTTPSFCEKPPEGLGQACSDSQECEGYAASYCETVQAHACLVNDCQPDPSKCHGDWVCCDIGLLSQSLCLPPDQLESDGSCPAGGTLVPREE